MRKFKEKSLHLWGAERIYKDNSQLQIEDFVFPYGKLDPENDWVQLATLVPWDAAGNLLKTTTALGLETSITYDSMGRPTSQTDPMGHAVTFLYDAKGRLIDLTNADGTTVSYTYDANGNTLTTTDETGNTVSYVYDAAGRMTERTDALGHKIAYEYDKMGNQTSLTYPDGTAVSRTYDALGQLLQVTDAENEKYTYTYDDAGNVTRLVYPNGWVEDYTYDEERNLLKTVDTDPFHNNKVSTKYEYRYDAEGNMVSEYKRDTTAANRPLTTTYGYDALNWLVSAHEEGVGVNTTRTYQYDSLGKRNGEDCPPPTWDNLEEQNTMDPKTVCCPTGQPQSFFTQK